MTKLPMLKAKDLIRVLIKLGFYQVRQRGSHIFFAHADSRTTLVPKHGGEDVGKGLLSRILREIKISPEEFLKYL
jgi:predicted RNA binding protein YcfA (HicA-like mRNA interferase family)